MRQDGRVDYFEMAGGTDLEAVKRFYADAFGWAFTDYGPAYAGVDNAGLDGGFQADAAEAAPAPLVILYADDLDAMADRVTAAGGVILRPAYAFPGGRRFHFRDPAGNELAVWSEK
jgi:predicted enzyme related to lactoylglutathione lyase